MNNEIFAPQNQKAIGTIMRMVVPGIDNELAHQLAMVELDNLRLISFEKPEILECDPITAVAAIRSAIRMGLSLDPNLKLVYVMTRNVKVANEWRKKLEIRPSVNGLLWMAKQSGAIDDWKRPIVEFDDDGKVLNVSFEYKTNGEWKEVRKGKDFFERLRAYSEKQNKGTANALYASHNGFIDPEFAATKVMRHVLNKLGINPVVKRDLEIKFNPVVENLEQEDYEIAFDSDDVDLDI